MTHSEDGPAPSPRRHEGVMARGAVMAIALTTPPVVAVAAAMHGTGGAVAAGAGLGLVGVLFVAGALAQGWAARFAPQTLVSIVAAGFCLRLLAYLAALAALAPLAWLHRPSLALATAVGVVVTTAVEFRVLARTPSLWFVDTGQRSMGGALR